MTGLALVIAQCLVIASYDATRPGRAVVTYTPELGAWQGWITMEVLRQTGWIRR